MRRGIWVEDAEADTLIPGEVAGADEGLQTVLAGGKADGFGGVAVTDVGLTEEGDVERGAAGVGLPHVTSSFDVGVWSDAPIERGAGWLGFEAGVLPKKLPLFPRFLQLPIPL